MKLGAHVSTSGGIETSIDRGVDIGCEAIQIFGSAPQRWAFKRAPDEKIAAFKEKREGSGIDSVFFHCIYLINLGTPKPQNVKMGIKSLKNYMDLAHEIGADGIIFHPGSHMGRGYDAILKQTVESIIDVLEDSPEGPWLTIENTAGMGRHIGSKFREIGQIIHTVGSPRVKVCLDTEHSFAAGYDVATKDGLEAAMDEFDREIGLDRLVARPRQRLEAAVGVGNRQARKHWPGAHRRGGVREYHGTSGFQGRALLPGGAGNGGRRAGQGEFGHPEGHSLAFGDCSLIRLSPEEFEEMVVQCYEGLPEGLLGYLENLDIVVEEWPSEEVLEDTDVGSADGLLGLYMGVSRLERGDYLPFLPDKIALFQRPIRGDLRLQGGSGRGGAEDAAARGGALSGDGRGLFGSAWVFLGLGDGIARNAE